MTNNRSVLLISAIALILLALVPAVSANVIIDTDLVNFVDTSISIGEHIQPSETRPAYFSELVLTNVQDRQNLAYIAFVIPGNAIDSGLKEGVNELTYQFNGGDSKPCRIYVNFQKNFIGQIIATDLLIFFHDWDIGDATGTKSIVFDRTILQKDSSRHTEGGAPNPHAYWYWKNPMGYECYTSIHSAFIASWVDFKNHLTVIESSEESPTSYYTISLKRVIDGVPYPSRFETLLNGNTTFYNEASNDIEIVKAFGLIDEIKITGGQKTFTFPLTSETTTEPEVVLRTGTVTMTDHNGTTISGFDVRAVNYYTGEEYTVSTDTDVATITLPMDRTIALRNPQTGQYEDVPVGYYTFFVSKPGYKMTSEDGVRISVLPLEYSPYHFGDIIVTSEDGYLTGKHQFQIRSRADKRILQTGTISAQSATTGEWYNTTVVNGIASLILPYDTSHSLYPYVGNYYVYATSPGYIPSEYATQISVRPDTQSEIRYILLTPIGGIPEAGNVTLRIQVFSESGPGIPNAEIHIDGVEGQGWEIWETYTASSTGYLEVSVPGNSTYDITVYAQGYYDTYRRIEVGDTDPPFMEIILYPTGAPTLTPPTTQPTGWVTPPPTTKPPGIPDEDDKSEGFLMEAIRGISKAFGVGFATGKTIFGMLLALAIGFATAKHLRGGAAEFGIGLLGGTMLGVLIGLLPIWTVVVLLLIVGMYIGYRYVGGGNNG